MFDRLTEKVTEFAEKASEKISSFLGENAPKGIAKSPNYKSVRMLADHHTLSSLLPYEAFDPESSLYINKKSMGFILRATTLLGSGEETENIFASIISDILPPKADMQLLLWASPKIAPMINLFQERRSKNETFAWLAEMRADYLKKGAYESLSSFGSFILRDFQLFVVVSLPKKQTDAAGELIRLRDDLESSLKSINISTSKVNPSEFISLMTDLTAPSRDLMPTDARWNELDSLSLQMTNPEWHLRVRPNSLLFSSEEEAVEVRCLTVREYPEKATQWKVAENLGQLFNATLQIPCPFLISFSIRKMDQEKAVAQTQFTSMNRESTANSPLAKYKPSVNKEHADWKFVRQRLSEGDSLVKTFYQVMLFCEPEKANGCERRVRDLFRANGWKLRKESFLQLQTWLAALPMMMTEGLFEDLKIFGRLQTMTAFNAVNVAPLQGEWTGTKTPSLILPGRRGQIASWNPFDNERGNYNVSIMAAPGRGKSALTQEYIVSILSADGRVWVIDVGRSYEKTCKALNGQFMEFTRTSKICINPFSNIIEINESVEMLKLLLASMARPIQGANEEELSFLEQASQAAWERLGKKATITTVAEWLNEQENPIARNLSHLLHSYTKDGAYARFFEGECTVDFSNPFIVVELQDLDDKKTLRRIVLQVLMCLISEAMFLSGRKQIKSCIIDEAWELFDSDNIETAKFIEAGYRKARKHRGNFVSIAHSFEDFHKNAMSRASYNCSDFKIILGQTDEAINKLKQEKIMDMNGHTERLFKSLKLTNEYSECVIMGPDGLSVHRVVFDPYSRILYSTKGEEFDAVETQVNDGVPLKEAIFNVARQFNHV